MPEPHRDPHRPDGRTGQVPARTEHPPPGRLAAAVGPTAEVLRSRWVPRLLGSALLGRLPTGMAALALVHFVRGHGGEYALAGLLTGGFALSSALGRPVLARLIDRSRQTGVLVGAAAIAAAAFCVLGLLDPAAVPALALATVLVAGFCQPPLEPCLRALWSVVLPDDRRLPAAYSLDAAAQELIFVCGPLVVLGAISLGGSSAGLVAAALLSAAGTALFAGTEPSRQWRAGPREERHWLGPLRSGRLARLIVAFTLVGGGVGLFTVAITAYAEGRGVAAAGGWLIAANGFGALLGGIVYTTLAGRAVDQAQRVRVLVALLLAGYIPLLLYPPVPAMVPLAVLSGVFLAPTMACAFSLIDVLAPRGTVTEAFGWQETGFSVGYAGGSALAGVLVDQLSDRAALAAAPVAMALALSLVVRRLAVAPRDRRGTTKMAG